MRTLVTGVAGFVGSHLAEALVSEGHDVVGVDSFTDYYRVEQKRQNVTELTGSSRFQLVEADLVTQELDALTADTDVVFHLAGQPGVRLSWEREFMQYAERNVVATQRLLEACRRREIERFVYASSSSVYGNAERYPTDETDLPQPFSPYGVTKLAGEHLCGLYASNWGVPAVSLRYFTVYGPRQRPDMAFHRVVEAARRGAPFTLFGSGEQVRDFTYVGDVVAANLAAASADVAPGTVVNIAGGNSTSMLEVIDLIGEIVGTPVRVERSSSQRGDVERTGGSTARAAALLNWAPTIDIGEGLRRQIEWHDRRARE